MKYGRTYHFPFSEGVSNDDKVQKDWEEILKYELVMTEKLDGENTCIKATGVFSRSHGAPTTHPWARNMLPIWNRLKDSLGNLEIFGENLYGVHSIEYSNLNSYFYIFAIRENNNWLSWDDVKTYSQIIDIPTVPEIKRSFFDKNSMIKEIKNKMIEGSSLGGECEGFVFRVSESFYSEDFSKKVLKYVRKNHVKTDEHWTRNWRRAKLYYENNNK